MNGDTQRYEFHERMLCDIHKTLENLDDSQTQISIGQANVMSSVDGLRREVEAGFRAANGRTTKLEDKMSRVEANLAANDYFTVASTTDRRDIWSRVGDIQREIDAMKSVLDKAAGFTAGASRATVIAWVFVAACVTWALAYLAMHKP